MKKICLLFLSILTLSLFGNSSQVADDELYVAMFVDHLLFEAYNEHGMTGNIETLASMADIKILERVAGGASKMKESAEFALKIIYAYQEGKRGTELAGVIAKEVGLLGYQKIKNMAASYIKSKISVLGQLENAYQVFGALYNTSSYVAYVGMSIGLNMMSKETIARLEKSGFHKAAVWIADKVDMVFDEVKQGKDNMVKDFLRATENTAVERAASAVADFVNDSWKVLKENTNALVNDVKTFWNEGWDDINTPSGDEVVYSDNNNDDGLGATPFGDSVINNYEQSDENNFCSIPSDEDVFSNIAAVEIDWEYNSEDLPTLGNAWEETKDNSFIVLPNIPHYRMLWLFSGENLGDVASSVVDSVKNLFDDDVDFSKIGDRISDDMGFKDMKAAFESIGD